MTATGLPHKIPDSPRRRMTVLATKADYDHLAEQLAAIVVGFEATGNYLA